MKNFPAIWLVAVVFVIACAKTGSSQESAKQPLRLVQTISLPNVKGRLDHMDVDVKGKRLFVAGLENGTFEVVDLQTGKWVRSIPGLRSRREPWSSRNRDRNVEIGLRTKDGKEQ